MVAAMRSTVHAHIELSPQRELGHRITTRFGCRVEVSSSRVSLNQIYKKGIGSSGAMGSALVYGFEK